MDRLDLELYADRLSRHEDRLADDVAAARLRLAWAELERRARGELGAGDALRLEALGVLQPAATGADERALIERRSTQIDALARLQAFVERELRALEELAGDAVGCERPPEGLP
jgi:hypothetical protein